MATGVASWSTTAASNATADSNVNWAEGQAPSSVNNSARAEMASVALYRDDVEGSLTTGGTSTAYTATTGQGFASLAALDGNMMRLRFHAANGAAPTLAVDGLAAKALQTAAGTAVGTGVIPANSIQGVTYSNADSAFILHDQRGLALADLSITGGTAETAPAAADELPLYDASAAANRKMTLANLLKVINALTAETAPATDDEVAIYDTSAGTADKITLANLLTVLNALTEDTAPDEAADFLLSYDTSAGAVKKVKPSNLVRVRQVLQTTYATNADLTTTIPYDDTTPTSTEGTEVLSQAITPADNSNKVLCEVSLWGDCTVSGLVIAALFRGTTCIQAAAIRSNQIEFNLKFDFLDSPASASAQTYSVRVGQDTAGGGTVRLNGTTAARMFGGALACTLTLSEVLA